MGCRTRVMGNVYDPTKEVTCGRGNLSFTSINMPRLGIEAHGDIDKFYKSLDDMMDLVIRQLMHRFKIQCSKVVRNYPFLMGQGIWIDSEHLDMDDSVAGSAEAWHIKRRIHWSGRDIEGIDRQASW